MLRYVCIMHIYVFSVSDLRLVLSLASIMRCMCASVLRYVSALMLGYVSALRLRYVSALIY